MHAVRLFQLQLTLFCRITTDNYRTMFFVLINYLVSPVAFSQPYNIVSIDPSIYLVADGHRSLY